jgi:truncated hemoglobin YjbI
VSKPGKVRGLVGRLGGPERLRDILSVLYDRLAADPWLGFFFDQKDLVAVRDGQHAFLMRAFQEVERFTGRHPSLAHRDLAPIRKGQFDRRITILRDVLQEAGVDGLDIEAWVKVEEGMRGVVQQDD